MDYKKYDHWKERNDYLENEITEKGSEFYYDITWGKENDDLNILFQNSRFHKWYYPKS